MGEKQVVMDEIGEVVETYSESFYKIIRVNLSYDEYTIIKSDEYIYVKGTFSELVSNLIHRGNIHPDDLELFIEKLDIMHLRNHFRKSRFPFNLKYRKIIDGTYRWTIIEIIPDKYFSEENLTVICYERDIHSGYVNELEEQEDFERRCMFDSLTNVLNHDSFKNFCLEYSMSEEKYSLGIIFTDLNGLKNINDTQGHLAGNNYIIRFVDYLKNIFHNDSIYRIGGDEFIVVIKKINESSFNDYVNRLNLLLAQDKVPVASIGYSFSNAAVDIETIYMDAEKSMYISKNKFYDAFPEYKRNVLEENYRSKIEVILKKLTSSHDVFGYLDLEHDKCFYLNGQKSSLPEESSWTGDIKCYAINDVSDEDRKSFEEVLKVENICRRLKESKKFKFQYQDRGQRKVSITFMSLEFIDKVPVSSLFYADIKK